MLHYHINAEPVQKEGQQGKVSGHREHLPIAKNLWRQLP